MPGWAGADFRQPARLRADFWSRGLLGVEGEVGSSLPDLRRTGIDRDIRSPQVWRR